VGAALAETSQRSSATIVKAALIKQALTSRIANHIDAQSRSSDRAASGGKYDASGQTREDKRYDCHREHREPKLSGQLQDRKEDLAHRVARKRLTSEQTQCQLSTACCLKPATPSAR
jgi:hypothetical protein